ncbi:MAG TPA: hypothetical protein VK824_09195, partial [Planctomycetota bacterium]|nr:hypothetical protein [Planctomycetota bacterium]
RGAVLPATVVIKSFSLADGSTLPQIVRENRALAAARELGLVLEHELSASRFHYVMPYVPGEDLSAETARLHAASGGAGLDDAALRRALSLTDDLLSTLQRFHKGGLWHKDVKPGNVIVSDGRAHLVDFGLITPLASAMTLTTHGTEYFRDPEMVRLALRGVKVHEVDGIKFDVYGAGAVLFSLIEGSFPAHGSLSRLTRRCPEALRWIIRRAMADVAHRYASAAAMLEDLRTVSGAADPFAVRPADLPSLAGRPRIAEALALPIAGEDEEPALGAEAVPSGSPGEVRHGQAEQPAEQRFAGGARGDGDERRHERAAADAPPVSGDLRVPRDRGGMPAGERRWRPLDPPYGRRGWSRKGFAAAAILVLAVSHFRDAGASGSRRTPRAPRGSDVPVVSSAGGARAGAENGAGSYRGGPESGQDGSARPAAMRGDASSDGDGETSAVEAAHAVLRAEGIEMLEPVSVETLQARAELQPPLPPPPAGLVLVLDDLPAGAKPERVAAVEALRDRLRAARYALLGGTDAGASGPPGTSAPTGTSEVELLAGARAAVGLADPSDMEAVGRLSTFLATQGDGLDAILWIGRADDDAPVQTRVIARDEDAARVLGRLLDGRRDG